MVDVALGLLGATALLLRERAFRCCGARDQPATLTEKGAGGVNERPRGKSGSKICVVPHRHIFGHFIAERKSGTQLREG